MNPIANMFYQAKLIDLRRDYRLEKDAPVRLTVSWCADQLITDWRGYSCAAMFDAYRDDNDTEALRALFMLLHDDERATESALELSEMVFHRLLDTDSLILLQNAVEAASRRWNRQIRQDSDVKYLLRLLDALEVAESE